MAELPAVVYSTEITWVCVVQHATCQSYQHKDRDKIVGQKDIDREPNITMLVSPKLFVDSRDLIQNERLPAFRVVRFSIAVTMFPCFDIRLPLRLLGVSGIPGL